MPAEPQEFPSEHQETLFHCEGVLVSAGIKLISFLVANAVLCCGSGESNADGALLFLVVAG